MNGAKLSDIVTATPLCKDNQEMPMEEVAFKLRPPDEPRKKLSRHRKKGVATPAIGMKQ